MTVNAIAAGTNLLATNANTSPSDEEKENKLKGAQVYDIGDFGAKGDDKKLNTKSIKSAIDKCTAEQGGTVLIPGSDLRKANQKKVFDKGALKDGVAIRV